MFARTIGIRRSMGRLSRPIHPVRSLIVIRKGILPFNHAKRFICSKQEIVLKVSEERKQEKNDDANDFPIMSLLVLGGGVVGGLVAGVQSIYDDENVENNLFCIAGGSFVGAVGGAMFPILATVTVCIGSVYLVAYPIGHALRYIKTR